jgi:pimeloyl-ACP methyl ester carboxylesterase
VASDVAAVLDDLGADRFLTLGWSGGGPHALACAALLPDRCLAAASIAGVAPYTGAGVDWGFRPADIGVPVSVWQGGEDRMVPFDHGRWLAGAIPGATVHLEPAEGHLSLLLGNIDAILAELAVRVS